jgi:hypothetical protein
MIAPNRTNHSRGTEPTHHCNVLAFEEIFVGLRYKHCNSHPNRLKWMIFGIDFESHYGDIKLLRNVDPIEIVVSSVQCNIEGKEH